MVDRLMGDGMMGDRSRLCSVWLGSETGLLKGVSVSRRQAFNFSSIDQLSRAQEVRALCWGDPAESELLVGSVDGTVRTFSREKGHFTDSRSCGDPADGCFSGLAVCDSTLVTCTNTGTVRLWTEDRTGPVTEWSTGKHVNRMRQCPIHRNKVGTGGRENGLKIWDLNRTEVALFTAKNLRDDWLDLRRPYWVRDLGFIPGTEKVVTCSGYRQVHVFDPSTPQRRPVLELSFGEYPLNALSLTSSGHTVVVGNTHGEVAMFDLRTGLVCGALKGLTGSVRSLQCHPSQPTVASCGLDRFLRIHHLDDRRLLHKVYLKSRLNCLLLSSTVEEQEGVGAEGDGVCREVKEEDEVWDAMERVEEKEDEQQQEEVEEQQKTEREAEEEQQQQQKKERGEQMKRKSTQQEDNNGEQQNKKKRKNKSKRKKKQV